MKVYDPVQRRFFAPQDTIQLPPCGVVVPVRGRGPDDPWFAHLPWTNETQRIEDLPLPVQEDVRREIGRFDLRHRLLQRCDDARGLDHVPPMDEVEADGLLQEARKPYEGDPLGLEQALAAARSAGYRTSEIAFALGALDSVPTLSDALDGVEVVSVRQLAEEMRARD